MLFTLTRNLKPIASVESQRNKFLEYIFPNSYNNKISSFYNYIKNYILRYMF